MESAKITVSPGLPRQPVRQVNSAVRRLCWVASYAGLTGAAPKVGGLGRFDKEARRRGRTMGSVSGRRPIKQPMAGPPRFDRSPTSCYTCLIRRGEVGLQGALNLPIT